MAPAPKIVDHTYVSVNAPKYKVRITVDGKNVLIQFANGLFKATPEEADVLDALLARPKTALRQHMRKINRASAEAFSREYQKQHAQRAVSGPFDSNAQKSMLHNTLAARNLDQASPADLAKLQDDLGGNMAVQEHVTQELHPAATKPVETVKTLVPAKPAFKLNT